MKNKQGTTTIRALMRRFELGRVEVENALGDLAFEVGANNTHLFDKAKAETLVATAAKTTSEIKRMRLQKLQAECELVKQKSEDYNRDNIRVDDALGMLDALNKSFWGAVRGSNFLS